MTKNKKTYLIALLWLISGYLCWISGDYLFIWGTSNLVEPASKYIRSIFHLNVSLAFLAFIVLLITYFIIVFLSAFLLSRATGKRKIWFFVFIVGVVGPPLYGTMSGNIEYVINYETLPSEATTVLVQILMETIIAYLIITPLVAWLGVIFGNRYRTGIRKGDRLL